jgi:hypothetical protein
MAEAAVDFLNPMHGRAARPNLEFTGCPAVVNAA